MAERETGVVAGSRRRARAIGVGVKDRGAELLVTSRTYERAIELSTKLEGEAIVWEERHSANADVI